MELAYRVLYWGLVRPINLSPQHPVTQHPLSSIWQEMVRSTCPPLHFFQHVPSPTIVFWGGRVLRTCVHRIDRVSF